MKYRIVEYSDGHILIQTKGRWYQKWRDLHTGPLNLEMAKDMVRKWQSKPKVTKKVHKC